jgi:N-acetylmuramoyl-L-alanine amidase
MKKDRRAMAEYTVRQGDSTASIAYERGFFWETIWNHSNNAELRQTRDNPNVLNPGDVIFIPDKRQKDVSAETDQRHRFRRKGVPERLRIRLLNEYDEPRADVSYTLEIDGNLISGLTDSDGFIEHAIWPNARGGRLVIEETEEAYLISLGHLDPSDEVSGIQSRLKNLGIYNAEINGQMNAETIDAIREFQREKDLEETGELDETTRQQIEDLHIA